ncbi:MAG: hypothetical protein ABSC76_16130 [Terracidiphilus sp.]|jgi:hypothetical protein
MEISPISGVGFGPTFRSKENQLGLTDVFEIEGSSRTGDETYSPGGNRAASGYEEDEDKAEEVEESDSEAEVKAKALKSSDGETREISFFA